MSVKTAQKNPQFERSFADLAYANLKDKAPMLLDYLVGFQVIDKDEDDTKAAGVFGFKVGHQWLYAPVFFLNGELKGNELLYIKDQDSFVPMQENWVNYLLNRKPTVLGEASPYNERDIYATAPDFSVFSRSPVRNTFDKISGLNPCTESRDSRTLDKPRYGSLVPMGNKQAEYFDLNPVMRCFMISPYCPTLCKLAERTDLRNVVKDIGRPASLFIFRLLQDFPKMAEALGRSYNAAELTWQARKPTPLHVVPPDDEQLKSADMSRQQFNWYVKRAAKGVIPPAVVIGLLKAAGVNDLYGVKQLEDQLLTPRTTIPVNSDSAGKVWVLTKESTMRTPDITDEEKAEVLMEGYAVRDLRADNEKSAVYVDEEVKASVCGRLGVYVMLTKSGEIRPTIIGGCTVIDSDSGTWDKLESTAGLPVLSGFDQQRWDDYVASAPAVTSMEKGSSYAVIDGNLLSEPFRVLDEKDGVYEIASCQRPSHRKRAMLNDKVDHICGIGDTLLNIPAKSKVIKVASKLGLGYQPGSESDFRVFLMEKVGMLPMTAWSNGSTYQIEYKEDLSDPMSVTEAAVHLIRDFGVTKEAARMMLRRAREDGSKTFFVKRSQLWSGPVGPGPAGPPVNQLDHLTQYDSQLNVPVGYHASDLQTVDGRGIYANEWLYHPLLGPDQTTMNTAIQAANTGQKEVLDTTVLATLVKSMEVDSVIDKYLGDLIVAEDRLGRMLFMFYWHNSKFRDRYGDNEMAELEDSLKSSFKNIGDLVLFLKKKSVEPDTELLGSNVELEQSPV